MKRLLFTIAACACALVLPGVANAQGDTTLIIDGALSPSISVPGVITTKSSEIDAAIAVHPVSHNAIGYGLAYWTDNAVVQPVFTLTQGTFHESAFMPSVGIRVIPRSSVYLNAGYLSRTERVDTQSITLPKGIPRP